MKTINKRILLLVSVTSVFLAVVALLMFSMMSNAHDYAMKSVNKHIYENNILTNAGDIIDANGKVLATTGRSLPIPSQTGQDASQFLSKLRTPGVG